MTLKAKFPLNAISVSVASLASLTLLAPATSLAADWYVSGSVGLVLQDDASNDGNFTSDFTTGSVTGVTPPLTIPAGESVGWDTKFDDGVLITGNVGDLGVTVGDLVANGQGEMQTKSLFLNAYYDFENSTNFTPFLGGGLGYSNIDVNYKPSDVEIINDDDDVFSYQVSGGVSYAFNDQFHVVGSVQSAS